MCISQVSHSARDADWARSFAQALQERGVTVWFDEFDVRPGESVRDALEAGLRSRDVLGGGPDSALSAPLETPLSKDLFNWQALGSSRMNLMRLILACRRFGGECSSWGSIVRSSVNSNSSFRIGTENNRDALGTYCVNFLNRHSSSMAFAVKILHFILTITALQPFHRRFITGRPG
jgi:hypothetical protein